MYNVFVLSDQHEGDFWLFNLETFTYQCCINFFPFKNAAKAESVASSSSKNNTVATDDLSVDAKSSLSSKPESEKSGPSDLSGKVVVSAGAASSGGSSWGGGRSFAEIVKKQEPGEVVAK